MAAGQSWSGNAHEGERWRVVDTDNVWNDLKFDEHYTVTADCNQIWTVNPTYCAPACDGNATGLVLVSGDGSQTVNISEGQKVCADDINFNHGFIRVNTSGNVGSMKIWIRGAVSSDKVENFTPYDSKSFDIVNGTYNVTTTIYSERDKGGVECSQKTFTFTIETCSDVCLSLIHI